MLENVDLICEGLKTNFGSPISDKFKPTKQQIPVVKMKGIVLRSDKNKYFGFGRALKKMKNGKCLSCEGDDHIYFIFEGVLHCAHRWNGIIYELVNIDSKLIISEKWYIADEPNFSMPHAIIDFRK